MKMGIEGTVTRMAWP